MTQEQVVWTVVIEIVVGLFLIFVGVVLQAPLKRAWVRLNAPPPLTPLTRGQLITQRMVWEAELERLTRLSTDAKELFLHLVQLSMTAMFLSIVALWLYAVRSVFSLPPVPQTAALIPVLEVVVLTFAGAVSAGAVWEAGRLSAKKIDMTKKNAQERIDEINKRLGPE